MSDTSAAGILALGASLTAISIGLVGIRFWLRSRQKVPLLADDWLFLASVLLFLGAAICSWLMIRFKGQGYSTWKLNPEYIKAHSKINNLLELATSLLTVPSLACSKLSALFFYKRVFCSGGINSRFLFVVNTSIGILCCWLVVFEFLLGYQCHGHTTALWDGNYAKYCTLSVPVLYGQSISDLLLDIWILALPLPMIARLHVNTTKKFSIAAVFLLGLAGLAGSTARLAVIDHVQHLGVAAANKADPEHETTRIGFFLLFEAGITIVAVGLPPLWSFFAHVAPEAVLKGMRSVTQLASGASSRKSSRKHSAEHLEDTDSLNPLSKAQSLNDQPPVELKRLEQVEQAAL